MIQGDSGPQEAGGAAAPPAPRSLRHNHPTREIKQPGECPACDEYLERERRTRTLNTHESKRAISKDVRWSSEIETPTHRRTGEPLSPRFVRGYRYSCPRCSFVSRAMKHALGAIRLGEEHQRECRP